ncbi:hypothetical protein CR513_51073, partial [Mucuna pruriens]
MPPNFRGSITFNITSCDASVEEENSLQEGENDAYTKRVDPILEGPITQNTVKLYHYTFLDDFVHQGTRVESVIKRRLASKRSYPSSFSGLKDRERPRKDRSPNNGSAPSHGQKEETTLPNLSSSKSISIKCFKCLGKGHIASQCLNRRTMVMG